MTVVYSADYLLLDDVVTATLVTGGAVTVENVSVLFDELTKADYQVGASIGVAPTDVVLVVFTATLDSNDIDQACTLAVAGVTYTVIGVRRTPDLNNQYRVIARAQA